MSFRVLNNLAAANSADCGVASLFINGTITDRCTATFGEELSFSLKVRRALGVVRTVMFLSEDRCEDVRIEGNWSELVDGYDVYTFSRSIVPKAGLYFYGFEIHSSSGVWYLDENGVIIRDRVHNDRVLVCDEKYDAPEWLDGGIIYHIFVDRFFKGTKSVPVRSDAVIYTDWDNGVPEYPEYPGAFLRNNTFFGGTLWGVTEKLDYLKALGVNCIYLSPVFEAYSNHKYDTGNYMKVDEMFGGDEALRDLFVQADKRGIGVILDGVFNHVGDDSIYFDHFGKYGGNGAYYGKTSPYFDWFDFIEFPDKYEAWWGIGNLPRVRRTESFRKLIYGEGGVVEKYMNMGAAGFRLDVVDELEQSFTERLASAVKAIKNDAYIVGEVWEDASDKIAYDERKYYFCGAQLDGVMNYPLRDGIIRYLLNADGALLGNIATTLYRHYPKHKSAYLMNVLGTHDTERILTVLGGDRAEECTNAEKAVKRMTRDRYALAVKRLKLASLLQMTLPGIPCVYYGDEVGMEGYKDPFNRRPYPWKNVDKEIFSWYKQLTAMRKKFSAFSSQEFKVIKASGGAFAFTRWTDTEKFIVFSNCGDGVTTLKLDGCYHSVLTDKKYKDVCTLSSLSGEVLRRCN